MYFGNIYFRQVHIYIYTKIANVKTNTPIKPITILFFNKSELVGTLGNVVSPSWSISVDKASAME